MSDTMPKVDELLKEADKIIGDMLRQLIELNSDNNRLVPYLEGAQFLRRYRNFIQRDAKLCPHTQRKCWQTGCQMWVENMVEVDCGLKTWTE
jgi:hypothetical protein